MRTISSNELALISGGLFSPTQIQASLDLVNIFASVGSLIKQDVTAVQGQIKALVSGQVASTTIHTTIAGDLQASITQVQSVLALGPRIGADLKSVFA